MRWLLMTSVMTLALLAGGGASLPAHAEEGRVPAGNGTWPLSPRPDVVSGFDRPDAPWASGHRGVDLAGRIGQPVVAALPGVVSFVGAVGGKQVVVVDHGDTRTTYEPVAAVTEVGADVRAGAVIGRLLVAGSHCSPAACLHLGWIRNADDVYLDPLTLFGARPVRLWPWGGAPRAPAGRHLPASEAPRLRTPAPQARVPPAVRLPPPGPLW